ncbi:hypothetical protein Barb4_03530 [Bacteroidales bacterium Barb4]|nr:hypothetical protein Barb4_03530 [Bacteroidales bacterium Barb4]
MGFTLKPDVTQMPRKGKRFQPHMQRSGMWGQDKCISIKF